MADYTGLIRVGIEGLGQIRQLNTALERTSNLLGNLENAQIVTGQIAESATRNVNRAAQRRALAGRELTGATRTVANVAQRRDPDTGRFLAGGPNATARRLANAQLGLAQRDVRESDRSLREQIRNRRLIAAAEGRYARAVDRATAVLTNTQGRAQEQQLRNQQTMQGIGNASRGNYLTNLFQGRGREFARGGAGAALSPELQQQARNVRAAWDIATAGGQENLRLMQRLATEMSGLVRQQNELNRGRSGRSIAFEAGRRGQERITDLSRMPGADPARVRRLRSQATDVITTGNLGDIAGSREATRRLNASIGRYERELNGAARELRQQRQSQFRDFNIRQNWRVVSEEANRMAGLRGRALPSDKALEQRVALSGQRQPTRLDDLQVAAQKRAAEETKRAAGSVGRFAAALEREEKRLTSLGIGAPGRVGGTSGRSRAGAIPMGGQGGRLGMFDQYASPIGPGNPIGIGEFQRINARGAYTQYASPAGPGNPIGIGQFQRIQKAQRQQGQQKGFFQGDLREALGDALIGGAFPLLFGQGLGASAGGAAGGLGGGLIGGNFGFGLSLAGTAIGQAADTTANNLIELADAIRSPSKALDALEKSGLASSRSLETTRLYVDQLTSVGRAYDAQTLVLQEVEKRLGSGSVRNLNALSSEQQRLQDQWSVMAGTIQSQLLPALVGFTANINDIIAIAAKVGSLPGIKETASARNALNKNPVGRSVLGALSPFEGARQLFGKLQDRGRAVAATSAGNRQAQTPEEKLADQASKIQESRKLADQIQSAYREAFSLQRQAYDLQRDGAMLNRDIADYSYKKEREIFDLRQQAAEKRIDNSRASAQNRIEGSDLSARQTFSAAVGFEQQLLTNVRESVRARKEGEADIEQSRKKFELAMAKLNRDVEDYKRTNAREIEDIEQRKLSYARSVEDYKMKVADHVLQRSREAADLMRQAMMLPTVGAPAAGGNSGGPVAPGAQSIGKQLMSRLGLTPEQAAGIIGNFQRESGLNPRVNEGGQVGLPKRVGGYGIAQWTGSRQDDLIRFAGSSEGAGDLGKQIDFLIHELQGSESASLAALRKTRTPEEAARVFEQKFERAGIVALGERQAYARSAYQQLAGTNAQSQTATQISSTSQPPKFSQVPIGPTPSVAPVNAANLAARLQLAGGEKEAQRLLEEQNKLKLKGIELGQIEQILQGNQLPQLKQQGDTLKQQIEARQKILDLTDNAASVADIEAESKTRLLQIEKDRVSALAKAQKEYGNNPAVAKQINTLAGKAAEIAKGEEKQRRINLDLNNKLQNQERSRSAILQLQEGLAVGKAEAAALERGALEATNVELLKASDLYRFASDAEKAKLVDLTAQTEELSKQNDFRKQINEIRQDARFTGAGLRAGLIGPEARAYEQGLKTFKGDKTMAMGVANETKRLENERLVWANLEKDITSVSDAISGGLTNGLLDIVSGARTIQDVGRDMLNTVARSFADSAQQQLGTLMQRQLGGLLGGAQGPLVKMLGAGAEVAGPQALGSASMLASGQVAAFGMALQAVTAQMAFSSALGGGSALSGALTSAVSGGATNLFSKGISDAIPGIAFGGFLAEGGTAQAGKGYVVGEKEPEFFFPGVSGRVVPRSDMEKAAALRQGSEQSDPLELDYTVTERQGERMVTEAEMRRNNAALLKQAQARTLASMRNSKEVRDFVNI